MLQQQLEKILEEYTTTTKQTRKFLSGATRDIQVRYPGKTRNHIVDKELGSRVVSLLVGAEPIVRGFCKEFSSEVRGITRPGRKGCVVELVDQDGGVFGTFRNMGEAAEVLGVSRDVVANRRTNGKTISFGGKDLTIRRVGGGKEEPCEPGPQEVLTRLQEIGRRERELQEWEASLRIREEAITKREKELGIVI